MGRGRTLDYLQYRAGKRIAPGIFSEIRRIIRRQDYKVGLRIAPAHTGGWKVNFPGADLSPHHGGRKVDIRRNIK
ncbi:hypothetical protein SDC9_100608 [bioreactor metagenome]|uniref:Uncharacterized protein n=1 Tax=bioreactor metagenome TaxID=1076179 RepID=A0A645AM69_9ZZZZ